MSKQSNKVKFGLKNCHYAKATFDEDGSVTYAKPVRIPGAVSLSMDANGEIEPFYADNIAYYVVNNNSGYEGDLEIALIPESFLTDIMHEELDGNGVLAENANVELEHVYLHAGEIRHYEQKPPKELCPFSVCVLDAPLDCVTGIRVGLIGNLQKLQSALNR